MEAITWSKFAHYHYDQTDLEDQPDLEFPFVPGSRFRAVNTGINEPAMQLNLGFLQGQGHSLDPRP